MPSIIQDHSVGPCAYSLPPLIPEGPSYSFGQAGRFHTPTNQPKIVYSSLTPEKYREIPQTLRSPEPRTKSKSMPPEMFRRRALFEVSDSPGPGHYTLSSTLYNKDFKLKGKYHESKPLNTPGPGAYRAIPEPPRGFPVQTEPRFRTQSPGPGGFNVNLPKLSPGPSYSFGSRPKSASPCPTPGPGAYDLPPLAEPSKISIRSRVKSLEPFNTPGPGSYRPAESRSPTGFSHGLPLVTNDSSSSPGPAAYQVEMRPTGPKYSMGKRFECKTEADNRELSDPISSFTGRAAILVGKPTENPRNLSPGPGAYRVKELGTGFAFSQGKGSREQKIEISPGPGEYNKELTPVGPKFSLAGRPSPPKHEVSPGPGHYDLPQFPTSSTTILGKPKIDHDNKIPGPGAYFPNKSYTSLAFSTSKESRFKEIPPTPGPGDFHSDLLPQGPKYSFTGRGSSLKPNLSQSLASPGPGSYDLPSTASKISARVFGKPSEPEPQQVPGPGAYIHNEFNMSGNKGFSMGTASRHDPTTASRGVPGPGAYDSARARSVGYSFPKEPRQELRVDEAPGPGAYQWEPLDKTLHISLRGKRQEKETSTAPVSDI